MNAEVEVVAVLDAALRWHLAARIGEGPLLTAECLADAIDGELIEYPFEELPSDGELCATCAVPSLRMAVSE